MKSEETDVSAPQKDCLFSPVNEANHLTEMKTPDKKMEKSVVMTPVSENRMNTANSSIQLTSPTSQFSYTSPSSMQNTFDESTNTKELSAGAKRRQEKNLKMLSDDSNSSDSSSTSVAHVSYCEDNNVNTFTFDPDDDYYKNAIDVVDLPPNDTNEKETEEKREPLVYNTMTSIVQPTLEEMMQGERIQDTEAITNIDDSLIA